MKIKIQFFKVHETAISLDECATGNMASFLNCALSFLKYKFFFCVLTNKFGKFWHHFYKFTSLFFFIDVWFVKFKFDLNKYTSRINSFCVNLMSKRWIYIFFWYPLEWMRNISFEIITALIYSVCAWLDFLVSLRGKILTNEFILLVPCFI